MQKKLSSSPLLPKNKQTNKQKKKVQRQGLFLELSYCQGHLQNYGLDLVREQAQRSESVLCPLVSEWLSNIGLPNICFSISMSLVFFPLKPQTTVTYILFCLWLSMVFKVGVSFSHFGKLLSFHGSLRCIRGIKIWIDFLLLTCLMSM